MNHSILMGRLGKDPEERVTKNGNKGIFFSLAVDSYSAGERKTSWYNIAIWENGLFPIALSLKKGGMVAVAGTMLPPKTYEAKDGTLRVDQTLKCAALYFLPSAQKNSLPEEDNPEQDLGF